MKINMINMTNLKAASSIVVSLLFMRRTVSIFPFLIPHTSHNVFELQMFNFMNFHKFSEKHCWGTVRQITDISYIR